MTFIDYEKAFHSVSTTAVVDALKDQGIEETYLRLLDDIYEECTGRITLRKQSDQFPIWKGVRQGDTISPKLFKACLGNVFRTLDWENLGLRIKGRYLSLSRIADSIALLSESSQLQKIIQELQSESFVAGLRINMNKTKVS